MNKIHPVRRAAREGLGSTAVAVTILGLGMGVFNTIFSIVNSELFSSFLLESERLVLIDETLPPTLSASALTAVEHLAWESQTTTLESVGALNRPPQDLANADGADSPYVARVTPNLFELLGIEPMLGRSFLQGEGSAEPDVVMLSYDAWQRRFGGRADVEGQGIRMNGKFFTVVGVTPSGPSALPDDIEVFTPFDYPDPSKRRLLDTSVLIFARLKRGVGPAQAEAELASIVQRSAQAHPLTRGWSARVVSLSDAGDETLPPQLSLLPTVVGLLMFVISANVANLLLLQVRRGTLDIRIKSTSCGPPTMRQVLTDTVRVSLLGSAIGAATAYAGVWALASAAPQTAPPVKVSLDASGLASAVALTILINFVYRLLPCHSGRSH